MSRQIFSDNVACDVVNGSLANSDNNEVRAKQLKVVSSFSNLKSLASGKF